MNEEKIISDLYTEIQIAKNTLNHNKLFSEDEELILYNEEKLEFLQGVRDLLENRQKVIDKMAEDLTTPIHNKEWIINYYLKEIEKDV